MTASTTPTATANTTATANAAQTQTAQAGKFQTALPTPTATSTKLPTRTKVKGTENQKTKSIAFSDLIRYFSSMGYDDPFGTAMMYLSSIPAGMITKRQKGKRMSTTKKFMGGKTGRMGPMIDDGIGEKGRYFQKGKKRQTKKFYETDKPHNQQMMGMTKTYGRAKKMHEITDANYYGEEKPLKPSQFRKNSLGNSVNMSGSMNNYGFSNNGMPYKSMYSMDTPRQKTPSPMGMRSASNAMKTPYVPYPKAGTMATGMGKPTMKRLSLKNVTRLSQKELPQSNRKHVTPQSKKYR